MRACKMIALHSVCMRIILSEGKVNRQGTVGMDDSALAELTRFSLRRSAYDPAMASRRVSRLLALEVARSAGEAQS